MHKLQDLPGQRVFKVGHMALALDFKPSAGDLYRLWFG
jgi:hypothetical protein